MSSFIAVNFCFLTASLMGSVSHAASLPDLIVTSVSVATPAPYKAGTELLFTATIKNQGARKTPAGTVLGVAFLIDGSEVSWADTYTKSLAVGASVKLQAVYGPNKKSTWTAVGGGHTLTAFVNDVNRIAESNVQNNMKSLALSVTNPIVPGPSFAAGAKGINAGELYIGSPSASRVNAMADDLQQLGVQWVRIGFNWSEIQYAGPNNYDIARYDLAVNALRARGIQVLGLISYSPPWANGNRNQMYPPNDPADFGRFAGWLATRYAGLGVHAWEIWNEPNISPYWASGANPYLYTQLLKSAYKSIKEFDQNSTVITAGLSPACDCGLDLTPMSFLHGIYAAGGAGFFDAIADHPYTYPYMPDATNGGQYWWDQIQTLHYILISYNDGDKKIWMTEFGAPTNGPAGNNFVSESDQATMYTKAFAIESTYTFAGPFFIYDHIDGGTTTDTMENFFGLLRFDGSRKPAWSAVQRVPQR